MVVNYLKFTLFIIGMVVESLKFVVVVVVFFFFFLKLFICYNVMAIFVVIFFFNYSCVATW
jgi:hypothetical protein